VYRVVKEYYHDDLSAEGEEGVGEDAWDMRCPLKKDKEGKHVRSDGVKWEVMPEDVW